MRHHVRRIGLVTLASIAAVAAAEPPTAPLRTRWARQVTSAHVLPEYPRPTLVRDAWLNLNGAWDHAVRPITEPMPATWDGPILVPFAIESTLSGVRRTVGSDERLWYHRRFDVPEAWGDRRVLLHFGAVDWEATVIVNGIELAHHQGGYDGFTVDVTDALVDRAGDLVVAVTDPTDAGGQPRGKQVRAPGGIFYTATTGIWQTVWLEPVPTSSIERLRIVPDLDAGRVRLIGDVRGPAAGLDLAFAIRGPHGVIEATAPVGRAVDVPLPAARPWSPEDPFLYDVTARLMSGAAPVDEVQSYFGMRSTTVAIGADGIPRLMLNGVPRFGMGMLDQGYWPDGGLTAPTDEALRSDIDLALAMGFNTLRKHVKVEPERWYAWCDRLGMLVWQDMPSGDNTDAAAREQFRLELAEMIAERAHHPCIVQWVPFNEGWGQHDTAAVVEFVRGLDPTRPINNASGWTDRGVGDLIDIHAYPGPGAPPPDGRRAMVVGEYGGLGLRVKGHQWTEDGWGYALIDDAATLAERFDALQAEVHRLRRDAGLSAAIYTQITDVETEANGLYTYDRAVAKIDPDRVRRANLGFLPPTTPDDVGIFVDDVAVRLQPSRDDAVVRYCTDGGEVTDRSPLYDAPIIVRNDATIVARCEWPDGTTSAAARFRFEKRTPREPDAVPSSAPGLRVRIYEGNWDRLPDFDALTPRVETVTDRVGLEAGGRDEYVGLVFEGFFEAPRTGVYRFACTSDDGSRVVVGDETIIENDGIHGARERVGAIALAAGAHRFRLEFFERTGGEHLSLRLLGPGGPDGEVPPAQWSHAAR